MKYYFTLQYLRSKRWAHELKIPFVLVVLVLLLSIYLGSIILFQRTEYASFIVLGLNVFLLLKLSSKSRVIFINKLYRKKEARTIRLIENVAISVPLIILNIFYSNWLISFAQLVVAIVLTFVVTQPLLLNVLPTPFKKHSFEFISGFRRYIGYIMISYALGVLGIFVGNINISYFSMIMLWGVMFSFYSLPEDATYVRIYNISVKHFLVLKLGQAVKQSLILVFPLFTVLLILNIEQYYIPVIIYLLGVLNLANYIVAKYSDFPSEVGLPNGIIVAIAVVMPLLLPFSFIFLFKKAVHNLKVITQ